MLRSRVAQALDPRSFGRGTRVKADANRPACFGYADLASRSSTMESSDSPAATGALPRGMAPPAVATTPLPPGFRQEHRIYGTTIYIGRNKIDTESGSFDVLTYQDLIHKGYILAVVKGDLQRDGNGTVYTRLHSSCVTSGTRCSTPLPPAHAAPAHGPGGPVTARPHAPAPDRDAGSP